MTARRRELQQQIAELERDFDALVAASASSNADDEHDPEGSTIAFERAQLAAVLGGLRARLAELDAGGTLDCERCGEPIGAERMAARPGTRTCVRCAARIR